MDITLLDKNDTEWNNFVKSMESELEDELEDENIKIDDYKLNHDNINKNCLELQIDINTNTIDDKCEKCDIIYKTLNGFSYCESCGVENKTESDQMTYNSESCNNVHRDPFMSFNIIGKGKNARDLQRNFIKTCGKYKAYRTNSNRREMVKTNDDYIGNKLPKNVIKLALELFRKIKEKKFVFRGNGKKGVIGACLFYSCIMNKITKTPKEISNILGIEERFLSQGDRTVQELNEKGIIVIPTTIRPLNDYLKQYFALLKIDAIYTDFIINIIDRMEIKNIHMINNSRTTTKAIGAIYLLINRVPKYKNITKDIIVKECKISKSTFIRYYNLLLKNYKVIKPIFKKHKISMPVEWKKKVVINEINP